ncbi:MAG: OadG family protein [Thermoplasmata archaeon]|nr:OadG family protein [Thermoplasmata archaeon]
MTGLYFALKVAVIGILIVFGVLSLLAFVIYLVGKIFIKKQEKEKKIKSMERNIREKIIKSAICTYLKESGYNVSNEEINIEVVGENV